MSIEVTEGVREFIQGFVDAENRADFTTIAALLAPDVEVWLNGQLARTGRDAQVAATQANLTAFPDWKREILSIGFDGNTGAMRWTGSGTHNGPFAGVAASGRRIAFSGTSWAEVEQGAAKRIWIDMDLAGPLAQMSRGEEA